MASTTNEKKKKEKEKQKEVKQKKTEKRKRSSPSPLLIASSNPSSAQAEEKEEEEEGVIAKRTRATFDGHWKTPRFPKPQAKTKFDLQTVLEHPEMFGLASLDQLEQAQMHKILLEASLTRAGVEDEEEEEEEDEEQPGRLIFSSKLFEKPKDAEKKKPETRDQWTQTDETLSKTMQIEKFFSPLKKEEDFPKEKDSQNTPKGHSAQPNAMGIYPCCGQAAVLSNLGNGCSLQVIPGTRIHSAGGAGGIALWSL
jgi:hypothetical protein